MIALSKQHRTRFNEIRQKLTSLGSRESVFVTIELLFYEALAIARTYGEDPGNNLLADLNQVYAEEYQATKEVFRKSRQRELVIRKFVVRLKNALNVKETVS
jgi:hypothetical protein